jgi:pantoate--beta-alanine ligase
VCQVVLRLFELTRPSVAVFGEKDWQQLQVVISMTRERGLPIRILPQPTLRDPDGLAMSSRNRFLSSPEREAALAIPRAIHAAECEPDPSRAEEAMRRVLGAAALRVEYAVVRDAATLGGRSRKGMGRVLVAAWSGGTRLIDNGPW